MLMNRKLKISEKIDVFVKQLRILADTFKYGTLKESITIDAFLTGVSVNVLKEDNLTL